jgi:hypothetical protein
MAKFLTTAAVAFQVENIISKSKKKLVLVSPYIKITKTFLERLRDASERAVQISIIYGKTELNAKEKKQLDSISGLNLYYFDNLHAKCYFNESEMVITSMNLYEFSERNNREMGIFVTKKEDIDIFTDAVNETHSIIKSSLLVSERSFNNEKTETFKQNEKTVAVVLNEKPSAKHNLRNNKEVKQGNCIRCKDQIDYDTNKPYCTECYTSWSYWSNPFFEEKCCHNCGVTDNSTIEKPLCYNCVQKNGIDNLEDENVLPLTGCNLKAVHNSFEEKFPDVKINSTGSYVYCTDLLKCGDVMFREGIEIRFKYGLIETNKFIEIIEEVILKNAHYKYKRELKGKDNNSPSLLFIPQKVDSIENLISDYDFIVSLINAKSQYISRKQKQVW